MESDIASSRLGFNSLLFKVWEEKFCFMQFAGNRDLNPILSRAADFVLKCGKMGQTAYNTKLEDVYLPLAFVGHYLCERLFAD